MGSFPTKQWAAFYVSIGLRVFPVYGILQGACGCSKKQQCTSAGKHPVWKDWKNRAFMDVPQAAEFFDHHPEYNIGIVTGDLVVAIDIDPRHGGSIVALGLSAAELNTPTVQTGGGGLHLLFRRPPNHPITNRRASLPAGIDIRGAGGFVVAPPSLHVTGGRYTWALGKKPDELEWCLLPTRIQELLQERRPPLAATRSPGGKNAVPHERTMFHEGERDDKLFRLGCKIVQNIAPPALVETLLAVNKNQCEPPLPEAQVTKIAHSVEKYREPNEQADGDGGDGERKSQADELVELACKNVELWSSLDQDAKAYATIPVNGHHENRAVESREFKQWLRKQFFDLRKKAPNSNSMQDAIQTLIGLACWGTERKQYPVFVRVALHDNCLWLDLADEHWRVVRITKGKWEVVDHPTVKFIRPRGLKPLPTPEMGGSIELLRPFVNASDDDFVLIINWLLKAFWPGRPFPILILRGEQGSAKSTTARLLRDLVDPNVSPLRRPPREDRDLMIAVVNGWVLAYDNLSEIPQWLSDALCSVLTGSGFATRQLYTDDEEKLFEGMRPCLANGIGDFISRPDLLDRALMVTLNAIPDAQRKDERSLWQAFDEVKPRILGALLDGVACGLANIDTVHLDRLPRMADFAKWSVAAEPAMPWAPGTFARVFDQNRERSNSVAVESSDLAQRLLDLVHDQGEWLGRLLDLREKVDPDHRLFPKGGSASRRLKEELIRLKPSLRSIGIEAEFTRPTSHQKGKLIVAIRRVSSGQSVPTVPPVPAAAAGSPSTSSCGTDREGTTQSGNILINKEKGPSGTEGTVISPTPPSGNEQQASFPLHPLEERHSQEIEEAQDEDVARWGRFKAEV